MDSEPDFFKENFSARRARDGVSPDQISFPFPENPPIDGPDPDYDDIGSEDSAASLSADHASRDDQINGAADEE